MMFIKRKARFFSHIAKQAALDEEPILGDVLEPSRYFFMQYLPMGWEEAKKDAQNKQKWDEWVDNWQYDDFFNEVGDRDIVNERMPENRINPQ